MPPGDANRMLWLVFLYLVLCPLATYYVLTRGDWKKIRIALPIAFAIWILLLIVILPSIERPLDSLSKSPLWLAACILVVAGIHAGMWNWAGASRLATALQGLAWVVLFSNAFLGLHNDLWWVVVAGLFFSSLALAVRDAYRGTARPRGGLDVPR